MIRQQKLDIETAKQYFTREQDRLTRQLEEIQKVEIPSWLDFN